MNQTYIHILKTSLSYIHDNDGTNVQIFYSVNFTRLGYSRSIPSIVMMITNALAPNLSQAIADHHAGSYMTTNFDISTLIRLYSIHIMLEPLNIQFSAVITHPIFSKIITQDTP